MTMTREIHGYRFKDELTFGDFIGIRERFPVVDTTNELSMAKLQCETLQRLLEPDQNVRIENLPVSVVVAIATELGDQIKKKIVLPAPVG